MFSLFSWFLYCSTCSETTKSMKPNGKISTERVKVFSVVWEKALFYREVVICFLINNLFRDVFQTSRVIDLIRYHCVKSVQIRSFYWSLISRIRTKNGEILRISPYSVQMQEIADQKKLRIWTHFTQRTLCETPMLKKYLSSWKRYFLVWQFIENQVFIISALFPCFSVFSLFKLIN